jgi:acetyl-CoA acetyltransferase
MPEAYIYDAVRTPRGRGKKDGALHEVTALSLATQVLEALRDRNALDTSKVDDVILGCVAPVGEQGADIARTAVLNADYAQTCAGVQINRFCASGLEAVNMAVKDQLGLTLLDRDEHMRPEATMQSLGSLNPSFAAMGEMAFDAVSIQRYPEVERIDHVHTPGNSSGIVDGAAGVLIGTREMGEALGLKPRARIKGMASIGSEPSIMLTGPEPVTRKLLSKLGMEVGDIDFYELNEAFAAVVLRYMQALDIDHDRINVNGGAIAMGHPLGATGAMILGTVLDELERTGKGTALATLCIGGGMGTATVIERV